MLFDGMTITRCPWMEIPVDVIELLDACDTTEHGLPPVSGGRLDQTCSFMQAWKVVRHETAFCKAQVSKNG
jgi:hypothetical protein